MTLTLTYYATRIVLDIETSQLILLVRTFQIRAFMLLKVDVCIIIYMYLIKDGSFMWKSSSSQYNEITDDMKQRSVVSDVGFILFNMLSSVR